MCHSPIHWLTTKGCKQIPMTKRRFRGKQPHGSWPFSIHWTEPAMTDVKLSEPNKTFNSGPTARASTLAVDGAFSLFSQGVTTNDH